MVEEAFFSSFSKKLREALDQLSPFGDLEGYWARDLYLSKWSAFRDSSSFKGAVVSCDGSIGSSSFSGGLRAWCARALAHIYLPGEPLTPLPRAEVSVGYKQRGEGLSMKALELKTLREAIEISLKNWRGEALALYDGSLYLSITHYLPYLEGIVNLLKEYIRELEALITLCVKQKVKLVGISKDSDISYVRARLLLEALIQEDLEVGLKVARERSLVRIAKRLESLVDLVGEPKGTMLRNLLKEFKASLSDEEVYDILVREPGFTRPLILSPQTFYISEEIRAGIKDWWGSIFRSRLRKNEALASLAEALDALYRLPPISTLYWRPHHGLGVYRVDVPSNLFGFDGMCGDMGGDSFIDTPLWLKEAKALVSTLNSLSPEPYTVKPLLEVDEVVRLDRRLYREAYEPLIVSELRRRGFRALARKRRIRDLVVRGVL